MKDVRIRMSKVGHCTSCQKFTFPCLMLRVAFWTGKNEIIIIVFSPTLFQIIPYDIICLLYYGKRVQCIVSLLFWGWSNPILNLNANREAEGTKKCKFERLVYQRSLTWASLFVYVVQSFGRTHEKSLKTHSLHVKYLIISVNNILW